MGKKLHPVSFPISAVHFLAGKAARVPVTTHITKVQTVIPSPDSDYQIACVFNTSLSKTYQKVPLITSQSLHSQKKQLQKTMILLLHAVLDNSCLGI